MKLSRLSVLTAIVLLLPTWIAAQNLPIDHVSGREVVAGEALIKLQPLAAGQVQQLLNTYDAQLVKLVNSSGLIRIRSRSLDAATLFTWLNRSSLVQWAEPNYIIHTTDTIPNDPSFPNLWGLRNTGLPGADIEAVKAWDITTGSSDIIVGVVDTGVDYTHPDLAANVWTAPGPFRIALTDGSTVTCPAGSHGFNAIALTCSPLDDHSHGSHVSGTIGAQGNNSIGVVGINWKASIMGLKFLDQTGSGSTADAINAIETAVQLKYQGFNVRVLNASWGAGEYSDALLHAINDANAADILFVAAAGNNSASNDGDTPFYPATYNAPNIISVAATDNQDKLATFSNFGGRTVHLGAPGVSILSTVLNGGYSYFSGTSMAAPHVTGTAALILSACQLNTAGLKAAILNSVDAIPSLTSVTITGGRLNAYRALTYCGAAGKPDFSLSAAPSTVNATAGNSSTTQITVAASSGFAGLVNLSASGLPSGVTASFAPAAVTGSGSSTLTLNVAGTAAGTYPITIQGISGALSHTAVVNLVVAPLPAIIVPASVSLTPGGQAALSITLATAAPAGGVVVTVASSDTSVVSVNPPSFSIGAGQTTSTQAQLTGVNAGSASVKVSAPGYTPASTQVQVSVASGSMSFSPASVTITAPGTQNLTLTLSKPAPAGGQAIALSSTNTSAATVPASLTIAANATNGSVTVTGVAGGSATITANASPNYSAATASVTVISALAITTTSLPNGQVGAQYQQTLAASGGTKPYTWSLTSGTLPNPLTLNTSTGLISGTPGTAIANTPLTFKVTDSSAPASSASVNLTLTITAAPGPGSITPSSGTPQSATVNTAFASPLAALVKDTNGNPLSGVLVTFTAPGSGATGSFAGGVNTATTNASGVATSATFVAGSTAGSYLVNASVAGVGAPAAFSLTNAAVSSGPSGTPLLTAFTAGPTRNNFSGWVGMQFTVGTAPLKVTALGRIYIAGNTGAHVVKLVNVSDGSDVAGGSVTVSLPSSAPGQFAYAQLASPITLNANTQYYLATSETAGGDQWNDSGPVTAGNGGAVNGPVFYWPGYGFYLANNSSTSYGPVNLLYGGPSPAPPSVSITAPVSGAVVSGSAVQVSATASAASGLTIAGVQFKVDNISQGGAVTSSPYGVVLDTTKLTNGGHTLTAVATDSASNSTTSAPVGFTVGNNVTSVSITAPVAGATVSGSNVSVSAAASAGTGLTITSVQFKVDGGALGVPDTASPYNAVLDSTKLTNGSHTLTAVATDSAGNQVTSAPVNITVNNGVTTVAITAPTAGATVSGSNVTVSASATAAAGLTIAGVQFQVDNVNQGGAVTIAPYSIVLDSTRLTNGNHTLTAIATDSSNHAVTSAGVTFTVSNSGPPPSGTALLTGFTPGAARSNFSSWVGMQFTVGSASLKVTSLGRIFIAGNMGAHTVKLVNVSDGSDVPGGSATVSLPSGTAGQFVYTQLASPVTLSPNTAYYLVSQEFSGGDQWYDNGSVTSTSAVTVNGPVYAWPGYGYYLSADASSSYVPLNLKYTTGP